MGIQLITEEVEKISRRVGLRMNAGKCKIMVSNNWEESYSGLHTRSAVERLPYR